MLAFFNQNQSIHVVIFILFQRTASNPKRSWLKGLGAEPPPLS